ncbi:MAG: flagellar biosynthesis anti-sigma factor FlgM [Gammaproteobacteria bacterium]
MKIDPTGIKPVTLPGSADNRPAQAKPDARADVGQTDVNLSARAEQLKQVETQMAAIPVVDRSRVESIKAAIANGEYVIRPENIAAGLLDSVREMLNVSR